jgi:hypothetical protein
MCRRACLGASSLFVRRDFLSPSETPCPDDVILYVLERKYGPGRAEAELGRMILAFADKPAA